MIAVRDDMFRVWTCSVSLPNKPTFRGSHLHTISLQQLEEKRRLGPAWTRFASSCAASPCALTSSGAEGFKELGEAVRVRPSGCGGERKKMEVRVGERLLWLAVLSSVLSVDSVLGKYVKGIVNTKEVSPGVFYFLFFFASSPW